MKNKFKCPLCGEPMEVNKDETGVTVICIGPCDPLCHENVFGHGSKESEAYEIACEKFRR